ncbi:hypothetical protein [Niastella populi]|uniref:hypothetical protein n=1 Tax=Niastella populi TaxID=550983 RepID=UPI00105636CD|nr:hypothetical protein [Niastella populi]
MKDIIKIIVLVLFFAFCNFYCKNSGKGNAIKNDDFVIKPELKKFERFIEDARFKIYLKMGARKVAIEDKTKLTDSMYLGSMNLALYACEQKYNGLMVDFMFEYGDSAAYADNSPDATGSVFYKNVNIDDWHFAYGDLRMIYFDLPNQIDTTVIIQMLNNGEIINPWFKKKLEDSIVKKIKNITN